jgi:hypothetical protein
MGHPNFTRAQGGPPALKSMGEGHLTRINDILLNLMEMERRAGSRK